MTIFSSDALGTDKGIPVAATVLAIGGLLPVVGLAALIAAGVATSDGNTSLVVMALVSYCAVILSFLGGIRWGAALGEADRRAQTLALVTSVIPSLIGWVALLLGVLLGRAMAPLLLLIVGFVTQALWDLAGARFGALPRWFARLRVPLTLAVVVCLIAVASILPATLR